MRKITFRIPDMHCSACVMRLESIEDELPGIRNVSASYHQQKFDAEYDENLISEDEILKAIEEKGYHAVPLE
jgi:copper chaperone CopZ